VSLAEIRALDDQPVTDTAVSADGDEWEEARQRRLATHARSTAGFVAHLARLKEAPQ